MYKFEKGDDYRSDSSYGDFGTYGIHADEHGNQIEVHGDPALRDTILRLLREEYPEHDFGAFERMVDALHEIEKTVGTILEDVRKSGIM